MVSRRSHEKMLARAGPILARVPDAAITFVEVGVNRGQLAEYLLQERPLLEWYGVDPWWHAPANASSAYVGTRDGHAWQTLEASERCYAETVARVKPFGRRATICRAASPGVAPSFRRDWATMIFIDADHSYDGVRTDIEAWWPVVAAGGWLAGHDYANTDQRFDFSGVDRAVDEFVSQQGLDLELDGGATWFARKPA